MDDRTELLQLLAASRAAGARAAEVLHQRFDRRVIVGERTRGELSATQRFTLRVWMEGGKAGLAVGSGLPGLVDAAMRDARAAPTSAWAGPADRISPSAGSLGIDDRRHRNIGADDRDEMLHTAVRSLEAGGVQIHRLQYGEERERRSWLSSREQEAESACTTYTLAADASLRGTRRTHRIASRHFSDVASLPFGLELRRRLELLARPAEMPDVALPVVLDSRAMSMLARSIAPLFSAPAIAAGNFLSTRLNRRLASAAFHLTDDAAMAGGLRSHAFDDRGVAPMTIALLKEGMPGGLYHDPESARAAGLRPTGHVVGNELRPGNLIVRPGSRTRNVILGELADHVMLDEPPPADLRTGRLSGPVSLQVVRRGEHLGTAQTHLDIGLDVLLLGIEELAADQERVEEVDSPTTVMKPLPWGR